MLVESIFDIRSEICRQEYYIIVESTFKGSLTITRIIKIAFIKYICCFITNCSLDSKLDLKIQMNCNVATPKLSPKNRKTQQLDKKIYSLFPYFSISELNI